MSDIDDRKSHMEWCKSRALAYLDRGDLNNALASFASDTRKNEDTDTPAVQMLIALEGMSAAMSGDTARMRRFIEGFR